MILFTRSVTINSERKPGTNDARFARVHFTLARIWTADERRETSNEWSFWQ